MQELLLFLHEFHHVDVDVLVGGHLHVRADSRRHPTAVENGDELTRRDVPLEDERRSPVDSVHAALVGDELREKRALRVEDGESRLRFQRRRVDDVHFLAKTAPQFGLIANEHESQTGIILTYNFLRTQSPRVDSLYYCEFSSFCLLSDLHVPTFSGWLISGDRRALKDIFRRKR